MAKTLGAVFGVLIVVLCLPMGAGSAPLLFSPKRDVSDKHRGNTVEKSEHVSRDDTVRGVVKRPAFAGFSQFIFPSDNRRVNGSMPLADIDSLLPYHSQIKVETTVEVINFLIDETSQGLTVFYDFYSDREKKMDPAKQATGLFYFRGKPDAPFAIVCPGGGFSYVGSIHEGFPQALELSRKGYNAFVLKYRVGSGLHATEDLAAALSFVFENAMNLRVSTDDYSLWGGSAGARMVASIGTHGAFAFGGSELPKPATVVMAYTGHSEFAKNDPPTFVMVSDDDPIVHVPTVERRVHAMRSVGVDVEYHKYRGAGHGFGLGIETDAEGWMENAIRFWEKYIRLQQ